MQVTAPFISSSRGDLKVEVVGVARPMMDLPKIDLGEKNSEKLLPAPTSRRPRATLGSKLSLGLGVGAGASLGIKVRQGTELKVGVNPEEEVSFETGVGLNPEVRLGTAVRPGERPDKGEAGASRTNAEDRVQVRIGVLKPRH